MDDALTERVEALERAVTDGDHDLSALAADADALERLEELESRVAEIEDSVEELDAATQALRGYVGNVRSVNRDVERRAETALAKVKTLESTAGSAGGRPQAGGPESGRSTGETTAADTQEGTGAAAGRPEGTGAATDRPESSRDGPGVGTGPRETAGTTVRDGPPETDARPSTDSPQETATRPTTDSPQERVAGHDTGTAATAGGGTSPSLDGDNTASDGTSRGTGTPVDGQRESDLAGGPSGRHRCEACGRTRPQDAGGQSHQQRDDREGNPVTPTEGAIADIPEDDPLVADDTSEEGGRLQRFRELL